MDVRQSFKAAFLYKCAEAGLTEEETHEVVKKAITKLAAGEGGNPLKMIPGYEAAAAALKGFGGEVGKGVGSMLGTAGKVPLYVLMASPFVGGAAVGAGLGKMRGINDEEPEEVKLREKIDAYRRAAAKAQQSAPHREKGRPIRLLN
jgi:hypothetical protein